MLLQVFLDVYVHDVRLQLADALDVRRFRSADARPVEVLRKNAKVGDAHDVVARAEDEERLGERRDERDDPHFFGAKKSPGFHFGGSGAVAIIQTSRALTAAYFAPEMKSKC